MSKYIFYTMEGYTEPPLESKEVDNCQMLGFSEGENEGEALRKLLSEHEWIEEVGFDPGKIIGCRLAPEE